MPKHLDFFYLLHIFVMPLWYFKGQDIIGFALGIRRISVIILLIVFFMVMAIGVKLGKIKINVWLKRFLYYLVIITVINWLFLIYKEDYISITRESIWRSAPVRSLSYMITFITYGVVPYLFSLIIVRNFDILRKSIRIILFVGIMLSVYGVIQLVMYYIGLPINSMFMGDPLHTRASFSTGSFNIFRIYSIGGEPKMLSASLLICLFMYLIMLTYKNIFSNKYINPFTFLLIFFVWIGTFSTSGYLAFMVSLAVILFFLQKNFMKLAGAIISIMVIFIIILNIFQISFFDVFSDRISKRIFVGDGRVTDTYVDDAPIYYLQTEAGKNLARTVFGGGWGNIDYYLKDILAERYGYTGGLLNTTRSFFLQLLIDAGIIGTFLYYMFFFSVIKRALIFIKKGGVYSGSVLVLLTGTFVALVVNAIEISLYEWLFVGLLEATMNLVEKEQKVLKANNLSFAN